MQCLPWMWVWPDVCMVLLHSCPASCSNMLCNSVNTPVSSLVCYNVSTYLIWNALRGRKVATSLQGETFLRFLSLQVQSSIVARSCGYLLIGWNNVNPIDFISHFTVSGLCINTSVIFQHTHCGAVVKASVKYQSFTFHTGRTDRGTWRKLSWIWLKM